MQKRPTFILVDVLLGICLLGGTAVAAASKTDTLTDLQTKYQTALQEIERFKRELTQAHQEIDQLKQQLKQRDIAPSPNWFVEGNAHLQARDYQAAIEAFTQAIAAHPQEAKAYRNRGMAYTRHGDYRQGMADFDHAIALGLEEAVVYNERGIVRYQLGSYQWAIQDFTRAIALDGELAQAYNNRGLAYRRLGNYTQAIEDLRHATQLGLAAAPQSLQTLHDEVRQLQERLRQAGFDPGPADGIPGPQTLAALRAYQQRQELPATGNLDAATKTALNGQMTTASAPQQHGEKAPFRFVQQPKPPYPLLARQNGWEGTVTLRLEMLADGTVGDVDIAKSSGHAVLDLAAQEAAKQWTHIPARHQGASVAGWTTVTITFALDQAKLGPQ